MPGVSYKNKSRLFSDLVYAGTNQPVSYWSGKARDFYDGQLFNFYNSPVEFRVELVVYSGKDRYSKGSEIYRSAPFYACSGQFTVDASKFPTPPQPITVQFTGRCGDSYVIPTISLYIYDETNNYWRYLGELKNGYGYFDNLVVGQTYTIGTYYEGERYTYDVTITSNNMVYDIDLPQDICKELLE